MSTEPLMRDLAARNPIRDVDVRDSTGGRRRSLAHAWSDAGVDDATPSDVLPRRRVSTRRPGSGGLLLVAASVAVLMGGTAAVTSGVADPLAAWVMGEDAELDDRVLPEKPEEDPLTGADLSEVSEAQAAEVEDREATEEEYRAGYERYRRCLSARGFEVVEDPVLGADGTFIGFGLTDAAVRSGADEECYEREWRYTDTLWQSRPEVQNHPSRTRWMRDCLQERGIDPEDTAAELGEQLRQAGIQPPDCLQ